LATNIAIGNGCITGWSAGVNGTIVKLTGRLGTTDSKDLPNDVNNNQIPDSYNLFQNYPNPFNPVTKIKFNIPKSGNVKLVVYDILGKEVESIVNENLDAGYYSFDFDASGLSSGVYIYKIETEGFTDVKKMILVK